MRQSNFALRLQDSLLKEARLLSKSEGVALNQFINVAVAEKGGGESYPGEVHRPGGRPGPSGRVVKLGAGQRIAEPASQVRGAVSSGDEHVAVAQQRSGRTVPGRGHAAGQRPGAGGRVVQLGARQGDRPWWRGPSCSAWRAP